MKKISKLGNCTCSDTVRLKLDELTEVVNYLIRWHDAEKVFVPEPRKVPCGFCSGDFNEICTCTAHKEPKTATQMGYKPAKKDELAELMLRELGGNEKGTQAVVTHCLCREFAEVARKWAVEVVESMDTIVTVNHSITIRKDKLISRLKESK